MTQSEIDILAFTLMSKKEKEFCDKHKLDILRNSLTNIFNKLLQGDFKILERHKGIHIIHNRLLDYI